MCYAVMDAWGSSTYAPAAAAALLCLGVILVSGITKWCFRCVRCHWMPPPLPLLRLRVSRACEECDGPSWVRDFGAVHGLVAGNIWTMSTACDEC